MTQLSPERYFTSLAKDQDGTVLLDVRSPGEFAQGHLSGAVSLPLFDDEERAEVGTLYKQVGPNEALLRGLDIAGGKMRSLVESARRIAPDGRVVLQCWRGGQRSASVAWLLEKAGMQVSLLTGGYKAARRYLRRWLTEEHHTLRVLSGPTGSGKTDLLRELSRRGEAVLDLEALACHKGSSFGALGERPQPTTEAFENELCAALQAIPTGSTVWLEDESRMIGTVCQPDPFYRRLLGGEVYELVQPDKWRIDRLVAGYASYPPEDLRAAFIRLRKRLGGQHLQFALESLERQDYHTACGIALVYYDKAYAHYASTKRRGKATTIELTSPEPAVAAKQLLAL